MLSCNLLCSTQGKNPASQSEELISCFSSNTYREIKCTTSSTFCIRIIINCSTRQCRTLKQEIILTRALDQHSFVVMTTIHTGNYHTVAVCLHCDNMLLLWFFLLSYLLWPMTMYFPCRSIHSVSFKLFPKIVLYNNILMFPVSIIASRI